MIITLDWPHTEVVESDVPWVPNEVRPRDGAPVIQLGVDPLYSRYPIRGFRADLAIAGHVPSALAALDAALAKHKGALAASLTERKAKLADRRAALRARWAEARQKAEQDTEIQTTWAGACIERVRSDDDIIVNEYTLALDQVSLRRPGSYFANSPVGGLGWGLGAALGAKLAAPERTVIAVPTRGQIELEVKLLGLIAACVGVALVWACRHLG